MQQWSIIYYTQNILYGVTFKTIMVGELGVEVLLKVMHIYTIFQMQAKFLSSVHL